MCVGWSHKLVVGNIKKHSLDEILNKLTNKLRLDHISNSINEESPCFDCDYKSKRTKYDKIYDRDGKLSEMFKCGICSSGVYFLMRFEDDS